MKELKTFTAIDYQGNKLGTCKASDIHEARGKLQRFRYGLIKFTDNNIKRIVTL